MFVQSIVQKNSSQKNYSVWENWCSGTDCCHFFFTFLSRGNMSKLGFGRRHLRSWSTWKNRLKAQCVLREMPSYWIYRNHGYLGTKKKAFAVKLARAKLPAMAAGILFRRQNYPRMQAKISKGTDCLRFPRVIGGNIPAPAGNLHEAFIFRVRADLFKPRDVSFYPVSNNWTKIITSCLWSQW